jgi:hypothetical protein
MYHNPRRLLNQITLVHGPHDLLSRYFVIAEAAARECGVRLRLRSDFDALMELNRENRDSWPPMAPICDPEHSNLRIDSAFWLEGVDERGETVITHAARFFDFTNTNLVEEMRSLRPYYEDPAPHLAAGEYIDVSAAPSARTVVGRTMYGGAVWVRPEWRRHGLTKIVPRISRAYAHTRWHTDFTWGLVELKQHAFGLSRAYGPYNATDRVVQRLAFRASETPATLLWMTTDAMLADVQRIVDQATNESLRRIDTHITSASSPEPRQGISSRS